MHMTADRRTRIVEDIRLELLFDVVIDLAPRLDMGLGPLGRRALFGAIGGSFEGPRMRGTVLAGGGDWALFRPDGAMVLDVRLTLRTHDDALIYMMYSGRWITPPSLRAAVADREKRHEVDPTGYYFRTNPVFETGANDFLAKPFRPRALSARLRALLKLKA